MPLSRSVLQRPSRRSKSSHTSKWYYSTVPNHRMILFQQTNPNINFVYRAPSTSASTHNSTRKSGPRVSRVFHTVSASASRENVTTRREPRRSSTALLRLSTWRTRRDCRLLLYVPILLSQRSSDQSKSDLNTRLTIHRWYRSRHKHLMLLD